MNFKKMMKRGQEGFTLVELIVVIAILGILGGIAVPAYSGYVEKAERAADEQLLAAVNTAFAAACAIKGESHYGRTDASISLKDGVITEVAPYNEEFNTFYEGGEFKVFEELYYDKALGGFAENAVLTFMYNGNPITASSEAISALKNSTFGSVIGAEALLTEVDSLTKLFTTGDLDFDYFLANEEYMRSMAAYLGVEGADTLVFDPNMEESPLVAAMNKKTEGLTAEQTLSLMTNGIVYFAAEKSAEMDRNEISNLLTSGDIYGNLSKDQNTKLAQASMAYGLYTAFVNSEYNTVGATSASSNPMSAISAISGDSKTSAAFDAYMNSAQGQADLDAYLAAMDVINSSTGNEATKDALVNGFSDPNLINLLQQAIGK